MRKPKIVWERQAGAGASAAVYLGRDGGGRLYWIKGPFSRNGKTVYEAHRAGLFGGSVLIGYGRNIDAVKRTAAKVAS